MKNEVYLKELIENENIIYNHLVSNITNNSKNVNDFSIYFCNNIKYLKEAILKNVKTIILEDKYALCVVEGINVLYEKNLKQVYADTLKKFYSGRKFPYLIGITGTCGKTTTSYILYNVLKLKHNVCLIGSNGIYSHYENNDEYISNVNTTPSLEIIYENILKKFFDFAIIEVSSQGLDDLRLEGLEFDLVCFLNLSPEHLDHHKNINNYLQSKMKLFNLLKRNGLIVINKNLLYYESLKKYKGENIFSINDIESIEQNLCYQIIKIDDIEVKTKLSGFFNIENFSAVLKIIRLLNIELKYLIKVLEEDLFIPGRYNAYKLNNRTFIIDYAHTSHEVESLLLHLNVSKFKNLITVIGCGGNRDKLKRPIIGDLSTKYSDYVIFTQDNNRNEKGLNIILDIIKGVKKNNYEVILNRFEAIKHAYRMSNADDIIVIVGRGFEKYKVDNLTLTTDYDLLKKVVKDVE